MRWFNDSLQRAIVPPRLSAAPRLLTEKRHKYCVIMADIAGDLRDRLRHFSDALPDDIIAADGRERDSHITVKYGLEDDDPEGVRSLLAHVRPFTIRLGRTAAFVNDEHDVLKIDIVGRRLHDLHHLLNRHLDNVETHRDYRPHLTIAYLKPGTSDRYVGLDWFSGIETTIDKLTFCDRDGKRTGIKLTAE